VAKCVRKKINSINCASCRNKRKARNDEKSIDKEENDDEGDEEGGDDKKETTDLNPKS